MDVTALNGGGQKRFLLVSNKPEMEKRNQRTNQIEEYKFNWPYRREGGSWAADERMNPALCGSLQTICVLNFTAS